ncbi:MAG: hypothetical protein WCX84_03495 [Syntrophales bacterium]|nr:hypothetical protein [Syntrophales bacterium]
MKRTQKKALGKLPQIETATGQQSVDLVVFGFLEVMAPETMVLFEVAEDRFNGHSSFWTISIARASHGGFSEKSQMVRKFVTCMRSY